VIFLEKYFKIFYYDIKGTYVNSDPLTNFEGEMELFEGLDPFVFISHNYKNVLDVPMHGFFYRNKFSGKKNLFLHNDIENNNSGNLFYDLFLDPFDSFFKGFVYLTDNGPGYLLWADIVLGRNKFNLTKDLINEFSVIKTAVEVIPSTS
jgi:hypothetical protein